MKYYKKLFCPTNDSLESVFVRIVSVIKEISVFWRGCIEDLEGARDMAELRYGVLVLFIESLMKTEIQIGGNYNAPVKEEHFLSMVLENGFANIMGASGDELIHSFRLYDVNANPDEIIPFCQELVNEFSKEIPNPMVSRGSLEYIKVLRNWVGVIRKTGISTKLIEDLVLRK